MDAGSPVLVIAGPTASGKSALAMAAALEFDGTVINADSMQVYRELNILTARPSAVDEARVPHRLFGVLGAADPCSAGRWLRMASVEIDGARSANRLPIVVGGTGLYLKALTDGLAPVPEIPEPPITKPGGNPFCSGMNLRSSSGGSTPSTTGRLWLMSTKVW